MTHDTIGTGHDAWWAGDAVDDPVAGKLSSHVGPKYLISFGLAVIALAMWHSTSLAPDADFNFFSWARLYQTISR